MNIEPYNFFFYPFHESHSGCTTAVSVIVNLALTIFSCGIYLAIFIGVRVYYGSPGGGEGIEGHEVKKLHTKVFKFEFDPDSTLSEKAQLVKAKQADHLKRLEVLAEGNQWQHLANHTSHIDSGFDWWMFPTTRISSGQGDKYALSLVDVERLRQDPEFIESFRKGVMLVSRSWGWNLETQKDETGQTQKWRSWDVRLGKMMDSLHRFQQKDLHDSLIVFVNEYLDLTTFPDWIQRSAESL